MAVEAAEAEVEALTGTIYTPHTKVERITLHRGSLINLSEPLLYLLNVRIYDAAGNLLEDNAEANVVDHEAGLVRIRRSAGIPTPPWYLSHPLNVEVVYKQVTRSLLRQSGKLCSPSHPTGFWRGFKGLSRSPLTTAELLWRGLRRESLKTVSAICARKWRTLGERCRGGLEGFEAFDGCAGEACGSAQKRYRSSRERWMEPVNHISLDNPADERL
ncbi:MAG: hypothetical protein QW544_05760 [Candidatus Caldarchaeum sp.]